MCIFVHSHQLVLFENQMFRLLCIQTDEGCRIAAEMFDSQTIHVGVSEQKYT